MAQCSIIKEIQRAEDSIKQCYKRVEALENKLDFENFTDEQRKTIENELVEVRKLLEINEQHLSQLHGQNRKSFAVAASIIFLVFLIYGGYVYFAGGDF